jgi:signal peptidase II
MSVAPPSKNRWADRERTWAIAGLAALAAVAVDQATKSWALEALRDGPIDLFWTLRFRLAFNSGAAFSLGEGMPWLFAILAIGVVGFLVYLAGRTRLRPAAAVALGLVAGGAVGNLIDRLFRSHDGAVVDFIDLQWWPVFNVADSCLTVGILLLILTWGREPADDAGVPASAESEAPA